MTPTTTKKLLDAGYRVKVEQSEQSIFEIKEFEEYVLACQLFQI